ncbi:elongation factor P [Desulforamulus profundi]|uniref:Elongation factor P n=1 Tax=Desulforamulus profundi TaxID=1383067 RepID=A0A2C6M728_9FIRM|nr:elongation factor P [Desulforamulus profundi]MCL4441090.1 elongation factor P [Bacillota bacterium]MCL5779992.1 elongation factor P [Bacillota bacterium]PHJ36819.1 elongation factor P [Desulforamulus profundi]PHJ36928.1 elongation factor P [Desulforamulus profundi]
MISTSDFRTGLTVEIDNDVYQIIEFQHVKPGKGAAFVRTKMRNMRTGAVIERTFNPNEKLNPARVERQEVQYLYNDGENYNVMNTETFDQFTVSKADMGDAVKWLKENMNLTIASYNGNIIGVDLPNVVELEVVETAPGIKGDTASGGGKPATLETGAVINVPFFVNVGDVLQVDTRTGNYIKRV